MKERQKGFDLGWVSDSRNEIYGFAILWIMVFHGYDWNRFNYSFGHTWLLPLRSFINLGNCGVELFLLLSGISLYFSFAKRQETLGFYKKRYLRLFPALWIINGGYWFYLFMKDVLEKGIDVPHAGGHFFMRATQLSFWFGNDRQAWYVAAIAIFYFMYPFVYHFLFDDEKKTGRRVALLVVFSIAAMLSARVAYPDMYKRFEIAATRFPIFFVGCGMGKLVYERRKISWAWLALPLTIIAGTLVLCQLGYIRWGNVGPQDVENLKQWMTDKAVWRYFLGLFGFSVTFLVGMLLHFLSWKPLHAFLKFFGNMSLELYLAHTMLFHVARIFWGNDHFTFAQYYTVVLAAIPLSFVTMKIEDAIMRKKPKKETLPAA